MNPKAPDEVNEAFDLNGRVSKLCGLYGLEAGFDGDDTRSLTGGEAWNSALSAAEVDRLREAWDIEDPELQLKKGVKFTCRIVPLEDEAAAGGPEGPKAPAADPSVVLGASEAPQAEAPQTETPETPEAPEAPETETPEAPETETPEAPRAEAPETEAPAPPVYETALRVTGSRGDWFDLAPVLTDRIAAPGHARYRVSVEAVHGERVFKFLDGVVANGGKVGLLGPTTPGKPFLVSKQCVLFAHWINGSFAFVTLSMTCDPCPV